MENTEKMPKLVRLTHIIYLLYALFYFTGISAVAAIIINYIKIDDVQGTYLASHFTWQIRTFWFGLGAAIVCGLLTPLLIGIPMFFVLGIWLVYRIAKGWVFLTEGKALPAGKLSYREFTQ